LSEILERVRDEQQVVEVTYHGQAIARIVPAPPGPPVPEEVAAILRDMDTLAAEIGRRWKGEPSAEAAVAEVRREL
jgi:antitoxin (DNA-binding transcriptional repressor) of toxin-antitoxin stability system